MIPQEWKDSIQEIIDSQCHGQEQIPCSEIDEATTFLSDFAVYGSQTCVTFIDEHGVYTTRCFDIQTILDDSGNDIVSCIENWGTLSYIEKMQAIVDYCRCCV